jgi:hypothetical protein
MLNRIDQKPQAPTRKEARNARMKGIHQAACLEALQVSLALAKGKKTAWVYLWIDPPQKATYVVRASHLPDKVTPTRKPVAGFQEGKQVWACPGSPFTL